MENAKKIEAEGLSKFQRYRLNKQTKGMKLLRVWVPDLTRPEFVKEAKRQGLLLKARAEEQSALNFIASHGDWTDS